MWNIRTYIVKWKRNLLSIPWNNEKKLSLSFSARSRTYAVCESMLIYFRAPTREHIVDAIAYVYCTVQYAWISRWHFSCAFTNNDRRTVKGICNIKLNKSHKIRELHASNGIASQCKTKQILILCYAVVYSTDNIVNNLNMLDNSTLLYYFIVCLFSIHRKPFSLSRFSNKWKMCFEHSNSPY